MVGCDHPGVFDLLLVTGSSVDRLVLDCLGRSVRFGWVLVQDFVDCSIYIRVGRFYRSRRIGADVCMCDLEGRSRVSLDCSCGRLHLIVGHFDSIGFGSRLVACCLAADQVSEICSCCDCFVGTIRQGVWRTLH